MSENSFPYVPRAALKRLFSASGQKSLPRQMVAKEGVERSQEAMKNNEDAFQAAQFILQHMRWFPACSSPPVCTV